MLRIQGPTGQPERKEYEVGNDTYHLVHDRGTLAPGDEFPIGPASIFIMPEVMRLCAPARRAVDRMFDELPLADMMIRTPHVIPAATMMEVPEEIAVREALVMLLSIVGAYEKAVKQSLMVDVLNDLFTGMVAGDRAKYTITVVGCITSLVIQMLDLPEDCDNLHLTRVETNALGPCDGPTWVPDLLDFIRGPW